MEGTVAAGRTLCLQICNYLNSNEHFKFIGLKEKQTCIGRIFEGETEQTRGNDQWDDKKRDLLCG